MDRLGLTDFIARLEDKLKDVEDIGEAISILKKQRINGKRAKALQTKDYFLMGIAFGDAMEIAEAVKEIESDLQNADGRPQSTDKNTIVKETSSTVVTEQHASQPEDDKTSGRPAETKSLNNEKIDNQVQESSSQDSISKSDSASASSSDFDCDSDVSKKRGAKEKFKCLEEFFPEAEWKKMSKFDKSAHLSQFENYETLLEFARRTGKSLSKVKKPSFMSAKENPSAKVSALKENNSKEILNPKRRQRGNEEVEESKRKGNKESETRKRKDSQSRCVPFVKKRKVSAIHCHGPEDMPETEYLESLPEYDVKAVLEEAGHKLKDVRELLDKNGVVFDNHRRLLVRTLTKYLFFESVRDPKDITQVHKEGLASSICTVWPKFKEDSSTRYSWHLFFNRKTNTGFIANCVQSIYRSLDSSERRRPRVKKAEKSAETSTSEDKSNPDEYKWISLLLANKLNHGDIVEGMQDSFAVRRNWISKESPSITEALRKFPHLMSYGGELIDIEFSLMQPGKSSLLLKEFPTLLSNVKKLAALKELQDFDCEGMQVLVALAELLPIPNMLRRRKQSSERAKASVEDIVTTFAPGTDAKSVIASKRAAVGKPVQPYLLAYVPDRTIKKMFIVCDSDMIEIEGSSFLKGLDLLFKSYFVFNVEYPLGWTFVFQFLEHGFYKINQDAMFISGKELLKRLSCVQQNG